MILMASRGTTFAKQDRDRAKKAKAAIKRERRETKGDETEEATEAPVVDESANAEIMRQVEELHQRYADKQIDFEEFDEKRAELMARITV
jgi:hypothetical protein